MIGHKFLAELFNYQDEDTGINQLLELLRYQDKGFINSLKKEHVNLDLCTHAEMVYLTKVSALIDYYLQLHGLEIPKWLRDARLQFDTPYYHAKRINDFGKLKLLISNPAPFRRRNAYFDLDALIRV